MKTMQYVIWAWVSVLCLSPLVQGQPYGGGNGQPGTPYEIYNATHWQEFMNPDNSGDWDKHFVLTQDIDFEGATLTPVAPDTSPNWEYEGTPFTGVFDGDNKVLSNFVINQPGSNHVGLFGYVGDGAEIKDLGLEDISVAGGIYVGILAGRIGYGWPVSSASVTNCYVTGTVSGESEWESYTVGGLCGASMGASIISNCYAAVTVSGEIQVGGLCGYNGGSIVASYATGSVSGEYYGVGGLCGSNDGDIAASYATSSVSGAEEVGGLCGHNFGTITSSYATGAVSGEYSVGGFCGLNYDTIIECYSIGQVTGMDSVGGFCGTNDEGSVSRSLWDTVTSGQTASGGGTGLNTTDMQTIFTYSVMGWGGATWTMIEGQYPRLAWEQAGGDTIPDPDPSDVPMAGEGTIENPWQIAEADHLILMGMGPWFWDKHYRLIGNLNLENESLNPIGAGSDTGFTGSFDGNGHTLSNLTMIAMDSDYVGLFGAVGQCGLVKNLTLTDADILGRDFVGALCGKNQGTIDTCSATGQVEGVSYVGGLVGANGDVKSDEIMPMSISTGKDEIKPLSGGDTRSGVSEDSLIKNSSADCLVKGESFVGGLAGANGPEMWDEYPDSLSIIIHCHAAGNVECGLEDYGQAAGGLCGRNSGIVRDSHATGDVSGGENVGGLCGYNDWLGIIVHAYATGLVSGEFNVGGLCGRNSNSIHNSYAIGNVEGSDNVGGLVGYNESGSICDSYAENGWVTGSYCVGGLVGYNTSSISKCYADSEVEGGDYAGGLVGYNAYGSILSSYAHGGVFGYEYIGGLIGYNDEGWVEHCFSTGTPTGDDYVGGFCGDYYTHPQWGGGADIGNFWDEQSSGSSASAMGTGIEFTANMKIQTTFTAAGWDFLGEDVNGPYGIWRMCADGVEYPRLRWEFSRTGDFVCDEGVTLADFMHFIEQWLEDYCYCWDNCDWADINSDGVVNLQDFAVLASNWLE